jgi:hypothetical protein
MKPAWAYQGAPFNSGTRRPKNAQKGPYHLQGQMSAECVLRSNRLKDRQAKRVVLAPATGLTLLSGLLAVPECAPWLYDVCSDMELVKIMCLAVFLITTAIAPDTSGGRLASSRDCMRAVSGCENFVTE